MAYLTIVLFVFSFNAFGNTALPMFNKSALIFSLVGFLVISITALAAAAPNLQSAGFVFGGVINSTEWPTGVAWMIGLLQGSLS